MAKRGRGVVAGVVAGVGAVKAPRTAASCRRYMRGELTKGFPEIVDGFVKAAKKGSCTHVKLATELLQSTQPAKVKRPKAVAALLRKMAE